MCQQSFCFERHERRRDSPTSAMAFVSIVRLAPVAMRLHRPKKSLTCTNAVLSTC